VSLACFLGITRRELLLQYADFLTEVEERMMIQQQQQQSSSSSVSPSRRTWIKPLWNVFHSEKNGKYFRQLLDTYVMEEGSGISGSFRNSNSSNNNKKERKYTYSIKEVILKSMEGMSDETLDQLISKHVPNSSNNL